MDIASTNQEHNLQTQVQLFVSSWILKNPELKFNLHLLLPFKKLFRISTSIEWKIGVSTTYHG